MSVLSERQQAAADWFRELRDRICASYEALEAEFGAGEVFARTPWNREKSAEHPTFGGGEMSVMRGGVFEKVGVNISIVGGEFSELFRKEMPGGGEDPRFWAAGISLVAHPKNPHVPTVHFNTRMLLVGNAHAPARCWFGGGGDLTPMTPPVEEDTEFFHATMRAACEDFDPDYYPRFAQWCDEYFYLPHRGERRGVGGIFYDYLEADWEQDFAFTRRVGDAFAEVYPQIVRKRVGQEFGAAERAYQLMRRGRYVEFNLLQDRGTRFGIMTGGNTEAILMSLPPLASW